MITDRQAAELIATAQLAGLDTPPAIANDPRGAARVWATLLNSAGLTFEQAADAMGRYLAEPDASQYRRAFPDPGKLIARSSVGGALAHLGSRTDAERAFEDFRARMASLGFNPSREDERRHLDPRDPYRNDAMFAALAHMSGSRAWGALDLSHPLTLKDKREQWMGAYIEARKAQRSDRAAIMHTARALTGDARRMLPVAEAK